MKILLRKILGIGGAFILCNTILYSQQQPTTRKDVEKEKTLITNQAKVLIIPFENKMYMSEIDYYVNKETKLNTKQIRHEFRNGLNEQLYYSLKKKKFIPIDLMSDTVKYYKDLKFIYGNISYDYVKIPDQNNYKPPVREKKEKGIQQGQIVAESDDENRFMNTRVLSPALVPYLYQKYKAQYYVFINELDLKASAVNPTDYIPQNAKRKIVVHYTIFSVDAKEINSGVAEVEFETKMNVPPKIIKNYFSIVAETIVERFVKQLQKNSEKN
ncbi:MAG: hypothetical protein KatS3mg027_0494 [Bacteroidia bacterium]|nr:MAG: hypothetical protein KatS3mg027_0494 [Bacteroidia bacterium]